MNEIVQLVGIEKRDWTVEATGEVKIYCALHFVYQSKTEGVKGVSVTSMSCPQGVDPETLELGGVYALHYTHRKTKNGLMARLSDLVPVDAA